jgi:hypothetical protein
MHFDFLILLNNKIKENEQQLEWFNGKFYVFVLIFHLLFTIEKSHNTEPNIAVLFPQVIINCSSFQKLYLFLVGCKELLITK